MKPEWLITSSVVPMLINDTPIGFPRKTLLARLGSVSIDANITLNEDEDEQEREVVSFKSLSLSTDLMTKTQNE